MEEREADAPRVSGAVDVGFEEGEALRLGIVVAEGSPPRTLELMPREEFMAGARRNENFCCSCSKKRGGNRIEKVAQPRGVTQFREAAD